MNALRAAVGALTHSIESIREALMAMGSTETIAAITVTTVTTVPVKGTDGPFRPASVELHTKLSKEERQAQGIFFTPQPIRARLFEVLDIHGVRPTAILEPSFGSGEFLHDAALKYPHATLHGVEKNPTLFASVRLPTAALVNADFLACPATPVDLVLGNPPYFVTKAKDPACMTGRGNIYVQFVYTCLMNHLKDHGVLAFVLPTSFYNCSYYQPCRDALQKHATILHCETLSGGFYETAQDTMLFVVRKTPSTTHPYFLSLRGNALISPQYRELQTLVAGTDTLESLGFQVKTGEIVWNEHKADLHDTEGTLLLYSGNIVDNRIEVKADMKGGKKQYIRTSAKEATKGPAILVGRGYGNAFHLTYAFVPESTTFYGENHVNVITAKTEAARAAFPRILASLADPRTADFIRMFVGNGAFSKTELESVLPIFA